MYEGNLNSTYIRMDSNTITGTLNAPHSIMDITQKEKQKRGLKQYFRPNEPHRHTRNILQDSSIYPLKRTQSFV